MAAVARGTLLATFVLALFFAPALAVPGQGALYGIGASGVANGGRFFRLDRFSGHVNEVFDETLLNIVGGRLALDPLRRVIVLSEFDNFYIINPVTGARTTTGPLLDADLAASVADLDYNADGDVFLITSDGTIYRSEAAIPSELSFELLPSSGTVPGLRTLSFDSAGTLWAIVGAIPPDDTIEPFVFQLYTINQETGAATFVRDIVAAEGSELPGSILTAKFHCNGVLYVGVGEMIDISMGGGPGVPGGRGQLGAIDVATGQYMLVNNGDFYSTPTARSLTGLVFSTTCDIEPEPVIVPEFRNQIFVCQRADDTQIWRYDQLTLGTRLGEPGAQCIDMDFDEANNVLLCLTDRRDETGTLVGRRIEVLGRTLHSLGYLDIVPQVEADFDGYVPQLPTRVQAAYDGKWLVSCDVQTVAGQPAHWSVCEVDVGSGVLTQLSLNGVSFVLEENAEPTTHSFTVDPTTGRLWFLDSFGTLQVADFTTNELTSLVVTPDTPALAFIEFTAYGQLLGLTHTGDAYFINKETGAATLAFAFGLLSPQNSATPPAFTTACGLTELPARVRIGLKPTTSASSAFSIHDDISTSNVHDVEWARSGHFATHIDITTIEGPVRCFATLTAVEGHATEARGAVEFVLRPHELNVTYAASFEAHLLSGDELQTSLTFRYFPTLLGTVVAPLRRADGQLVGLPKYGQLDLTPTEIRALLASDLTVVVQTTADDKGELAGEVNCKFHHYALPNGVTTTTSTTAASD